jgi:hypothetical protein
MVQILGTRVWVIEYLNPKQIQISNIPNWRRESS